VLTAFPQNKENISFINLKSFFAKPWSHKITDYGISGADGGTLGLENCSGLMEV
jgi:hypothetical protein